MALARADNPAEFTPDEGRALGRVRTALASHREWEAEGSRSAAEVAMQLDNELAKYPVHGRKFMAAIESTLHAHAQAAAEQAREEEHKRMLARCAVCEGGGSFACGNLVCETCYARAREEVRLEGVREGLERAIAICRPVASRIGADSAETCIYHLTAALAARTGKKG